MRCGHVFSLKSCETWIDLSVLKHCLCLPFCNSLSNKVVAEEEAVKKKKKKSLLHWSSLFGSPFWKAIGQTVCPSHSKRAKHIPSLPARRSEGNTPVSSWDAPLLKTTLMQKKKKASQVLEEISLVLFFTLILMRRCCSDKTAHYATSVQQRLLCTSMPWLPV